MERQLDEYLQNVPSCSYCKHIIPQDFATFDYLRGRFYQKEQKSLKNKMILFLCGAISGLCALTVTDPL